MVKRKKTIQGVLCVIGCEILFGFAFLFTKEITNSVSPIDLLSWRFIIAFLLFSMCELTGILKVNLKQKSVSSLFWMGVFVPVMYYLGETYGIKLTSASESGVIIACIPVVTLLLSTVILKESPTKLQITGVSIATAGIMIIVLMKGLEATLNLTGYLLLLVAVVSFSLYSVVCQKANEFSSVEKTYSMIAFGAVVFTIIALAKNIKSGTLEEYLSLPFANFDFFIVVLYLSIGCSLLAFLLYNMAVELIGTTRAISFVGVSTIVTVMAGIIILKEKFSATQGVGTALVIGGVYLANKIPESRTSVNKGCNNITAVRGKEL